MGTHLYSIQPRDKLDTDACRSKATATGQLNTILTFYEITEPQLPSELSGLPVPLLKKAIGVLGKTGRAQTIAVSDGEGVRFLAGATGTGK
jgi:hypothetical protein